MKSFLYLFFLLSFVMLFQSVQAQDKSDLSGWQIYSGSTHAHTIFTMSHGEHLQKKEGSTNSMYVDSNHLNRPGDMLLKPDWNKVQGLPGDHFALAKDNKYDFYVTTDHSQEECFFPNHPFNTAWIVTHKQAEQATDSGFVALVGVEHSENNGPGGTGHINLINASEYLNALAPGIDLQYFYNWVKKVKPYGEGPIVASFNHPGGQKQFDNFNYLDDSIQNIITLFEMINSNKNIFYEGFLKALDKGWKVSPVCGNDNHGFSGIGVHTSRTFVLAHSRSKVEILNGMKNRRTYASLEKNIQCRYAVNGAVMGSTLSKPTEFTFDIMINDPDLDVAEDKITKIDIVKDGGAIAASYDVPNPSHSVRWSPTIKDTESKYFFVRVWNKGGGDVIIKNTEKSGSPNPSTDKPVAWLAPVWTGR